MTEQEAKTKTCPKTFGWDVTPEYNQLLSEACVASDCMMWISTDKEAVPCMPDGEPDFKDAGYCGLTKGK